MNHLLSQALRCLLLVSLMSSAHAQPANEQDKERSAAFAAANAAQTSGPADIPLRDQAILKLPAGHSFVPAAEAARLMQVMGNRTDDRLMGAVFPSTGANWFVVIKFDKEGYIKDDDAKDWNADDLLNSLKDGTEAANKERAQRGIPEIEVAGWAEPPRYDAQQHRLVWSASTRDKGNTASDDLGVNYNTYALGREGYISLNLVTALKELPAHKQEALTLLSALHYADGKKYADFNASTDKVAAYGLATLVAGAAAKKLGLLAVILAFMAKFAKVFLVAGAALVWGVAKLFRKPAKSGPPTQPG